MLACRTCKWACKRNESKHRDCNSVFLCAVRYEYISLFIHSTPQRMFCGSCYALRALVQRVSYICSTQRVVHSGARTYTFGIQEPLHLELTKLISVLRWRNILYLCAQNLDNNFQTWLGFREQKHSVRNGIILHIQYIL
jgi:hypothetical protein